MSGLRLLILPAKLLVYTLAVVAVAAFGLGVLAVLLFPRYGDRMMDLVSLRVRAELARAVLKHAGAERYVREAITLHLPRLPHEVQRPIHMLAIQVGQEFLRNEELLRRPPVGLVA